MKLCTIYTIFFNEIMYDLHNFPIIFYFFVMGPIKVAPCKKGKKNCVFSLLVCFFLLLEWRENLGVGWTVPTYHQFNSVFLAFFKCFQASSAMTKLSPQQICIFAHAKAKHLLFSKSKPKITRYSFEVSSLFSDISQGISACSLHAQVLSVVFWALKNWRCFVLGGHRVSQDWSY